VAEVEYEYDELCDVILKIAPGDTPKIIRKSDPVWRELGPRDESYRRAIYLGQGCWDRLDTVFEFQVDMILARWRDEAESRS